MKSADRALTLLADRPEGYPETLMLAQGFGPAVIAELIEAGLARAKTERVRTGPGGRIRVTRVRITDAGREALKPATPQSIAASLTATERFLLFCIATDTDWRKVVKHMQSRGLIEREGTANLFRLTDQGRAVFDVLMMRATARPNA
jgi:hypothetical protein